MASLALGLGGAFIGSFAGPIGASIGWSFGAAVGARLFAKDQEGPKLTDLKLQNASYGAPIPRGYGTKRIAGNVIDQSDLVPHEHHSGGKGGPSTTTTSYSASLLIQLCETSYIDGDGNLVNTPIIGIKRIWAAGRLIYGPGSSAAVVPMTIYYGTEDQSVDPVFEALRGVGNQPPYPGKAYVVFEDWDLSQFGNVIPPLEFEVQFTGNVNLEYYALWPVDWSFPEDGLSYSSPHTLSGVDSTVSGQLIMHRYRSGANYGSPFDPSNALFYDQRTYDLHGALISQADQSVVALGNNPSLAVYASMNNGIAYARWQETVDCVPWLGAGAGATDINTFAWLKDGVVTYSPAIDRMCLASSGDGALVGEVFSGDVWLNIYQGGVYWNGNYYAVAGNGGATLPLIRRFPAPDGAVYTALHDAEFDLSPYTNNSVTSADQDLMISSDGYIYCRFSNAFASPTTLGGTGVKLLKFDADLNLVGTWYGQSGLGVPGYRSVAVWNSYIVTYAFIGVHAFTMYRLNNDGTTTFVDQILNAEGVANDDSPPTIQYSTPIVYIQNSTLAAFRGGILTMGNDYITLGEIVEDVSKQVGYVASDIDVSQLTDLVKGYVIADRMTARAAIDTLRPVYQFGAVESNLTVKFRKWKGEVDVTIPDDDLGARSIDDDPPEVDEWTRALEADLPQSIDFLYSNIDMDYQQGEVLRQRQVTESDLHAVITAPVAMTPDEATKAADMLLLNAWIERDKYQTPLPRKYSYLEPTDVVAVRGIARRFTNKEEQGYTHIVFDGVAAVTSVFVSAPMAVPPLGFVSQPVPVLNSTDVLLLDTPLVMDTDSEVGFNAAMAGRKAGLWPSAVLMKSIDGGANYASVLSTGSPSTFGVATTVLGDFLGGNIFDELNSVQVRLTAGSGELSSSNRLGVINGANMAILGSELLQFRNAELLAVSGDTKSYRLSGLLRGRRGTEWAINTHYTEDNFVLLPVNNIEGAYAEIGLERLYKGVTSGQTLSSAQTIPFTNTGIALKEYAPVHLGGGRNAAGDIILDWIPRARKHGAWINGADVPVADLPYNFFVRIYTDNTYTDSAFDALALSAETYTYTTEAQTIDFGSPQSTLYWGVAAIASAGLGYFAQGVT